MVRMKKANNGKSRVNIINTALLSLMSLTMLIPLISVTSKSFSSGLAVDTNKVFLWPVDFNFESWYFILSRSDVWNSFNISFFTTVSGTLGCLVLTTLLAFPLSKQEFKPAKIILIIIVVTMVFKAPVVPYFLTVKGLGLYNSVLVLIIPHLINAYNLIIMRSFFKQFPLELEEAAKIEGCGYFRILFNIVIPTSKPVMATVGLFYAVNLWNQFNHPLMFIQNPDLYPLQLKLRQYATPTGESFVSTLTTEVLYNENTLKSTIVIFAIIPMLLLYPYLQKYFVKGAMLGSVKG